MTRPTIRDEVLRAQAAYLVRYGCAGDVADAHVTALEQIAIGHGASPLPNHPRPEDPNAAGRRPPTEPRGNGTAGAAAARRVLRRGRIIMRLQITGPQLDALEAVAVGDVYRPPGDVRYLHVDGRNLTQQVCALLERGEVDEADADENGMTVVEVAKAGQAILDELASREPGTSGSA